MGKGGAIHRDIDPGRSLKSACHTSHPCMAKRTVVTLVNILIFVKALVVSICKILKT